MFIGCVFVLPAVHRCISSERLALAPRTMGSPSVPSRMSTTTRRRSRCGSPAVTLVVLTVALASAGCSAAADRAAFVGGTGARTLLSASARASCVPRTRRPGERDSGEGAYRGCCGCLGVLSLVAASMCCCGVCVLLEMTTYSYMLYRCTAEVPLLHLVCWNALPRTAVQPQGAVPGMHETRKLICNRQQ